MMSGRSSDSSDSLLKQALLGSSTINYTQGSIARATLLLAVPMILEMAMESVFAIVDIFFVAGLGTEAIATVGLTEALITVLYAIGIGLSMGITAMVARRIGEGRPEAAAVVAGQAIWLGIVVSLVVGLVGLFYAEKLLLLMGASEALVSAGGSYISLMLGGSFTILFLFLNNGIFRGAGDASIAMRSLVLANGINIVLDPCLIYGWGPFPEMGLTGAALATNIGRGAGVLYQFYWLCSRNRRIRVGTAHLRLRFRTILSLLRVSLGGICQFLIATTSWIFLMRLVSAYGAEAVAGYTIALRIAIFVILPSWGLSNAVATLVGQNLGAGLIERAERTVWQVARYNFVYLMSVSLLLLLMSGFIVAFFSTDAAVQEHAVLCLRIMSGGLGFLAVGMVVIQAYNGAGDTLTPTWINIFCFWVVQIPLAWLLASMLALGPEGVFWSVMCADALMALIGVVFFRRGSWKHHRV